MSVRMQCAVGSRENGCGDIMSECTCKSASTLLSSLSFFHDFKITSCVQPPFVASRIGPFTIF